jgi:hypothetical protein
VTDDPVGDELHRLTKEFRKLAGLPTDSNAPETTSPEQLTRFGLTLNEAKAWLEQEPNYAPADEFSQWRKQPKNSQNQFFFKQLHTTLETTLNVSNTVCSSRNRVSTAHAF